MSGQIPINVAVEDELTQSLLVKILTVIPTQYATRTFYSRGGNGYLRRNINGFNRAARGTPFLIGTDLDAYNCPASLIQDWLFQPKHQNLLLSVSVREAEAWVLADKSNFAKFLGIRPALISDDVEAIHDPKKALIQLAARARRRDLREDICPPSDSTRKVGPNYNARLGVFVQEFWDPNEAKHRSNSLARIIDRLTQFRPTWLD